MEKFNERLRKRRKELKITQAEIAKKLNITQATYCGYEAGKHKPDIETLSKIADILYISTDYLLGRYEQK